jgi:hypothetical protein
MESNEEISELRWMMKIEMNLMKMKSSKKVLVQIVIR